MELPRLDKSVFLFQLDTRRTRAQKKIILIHITTYSELRLSNFIDNVTANWRDLKAKKMKSNSEFELKKKEQVSRKADNIIQQNTSLEIGVYWRSGLKIYCLFFISWHHFLDTQSNYHRPQQNGLLLEILHFYP